MRPIFTVALLILAQSAPAAAQDQWREFRAKADGFVVSFPQDPTVTSRRIKDSKATQSMFLIEKGELAASSTWRRALVRKSRTTSISRT